MHKERGFFEKLIKSFLPKNEDKDTFKIVKSSILEGVSRQDKYIDLIKSQIKEVEDELEKSFSEEGLYSLREYVVQLKQHESVKDYLMDDYLKYEEHE